MADAKVTIDMVDEKHRQELAELLAERAKQTRIKKGAEESEKALNEMIAPLLRRLGHTNVMAWDDCGNRKQFLLVQGGNSSINRVMLINEGVDPDTINRCTKVTSFTTIQVRDVKEKEGGG